MDRYPRVSVIIPSYNGEKFLLEAIASVMRQTYKNIEVIVVDDGSTSDSVAAVCRSLAPRVRYIRKENGGPGEARNVGIRSSGGEYVALLDDDDLWMPEKLEKQVAFYEDRRREGVMPGLVYSGHLSIDEKGNHLAKVLYRAAGKIYDKMIFIDFIGTPSSVIIHRSVLDDVGLFDDSLRNTDDYDLWLRIGRKYPVYSVNEYLIQYRDRQASVSKSVTTKIENNKYVFEKVLAADRALGTIDSSKEALVKKWLARSLAQRLKNAAYDCLFIHDDAAGFRNHIRHGRAIEPSLFGPKVWFYSLLSYTAPPLWRLAKALRPKRSRDVLVDVADLRFT